MAVKSKAMNQTQKNYAMAKALADATATAYKTAMAALPEDATEEQIDAVMDEHDIVEAQFQLREAEDTMITWVYNLIKNDKLCVGEAAAANELTYQKRYSPIIRSRLIDAAFRFDGKINRK